MKRRAVGVAVGGLVLVAAAIGVLGFGAASVHPYGNLGRAAGFTPEVVCCPGGGGGGGGYLVTFNETGLPTGTTWSFSIYNGQSWYTTSGNTSSLTSGSSWTNGSWQYKIGVVNGYNANPSSGSFTVNGKHVYVQIQFAVAYYDVYFNETGLPSGSAWYCALYYTSNGVLYEQVESTSAQCVISAPNGGYTWKVTPPQYYYASPPWGKITVNGGTVSVTTGKITFASVIGSIDFTESGLSGQQWRVNVSNATWYLNLSTTGSSIDFNAQAGALLYNGTYHFVVTSPAGYTSNPQAGNIPVAGSEVKQAIKFNAG